MLEKLKGALSKMDGAKSILGLLGIVAYYTLPKFGISVPDAVLNISTGLAGVGFAHKLEKATGMLSKGLAIAATVLDVAKKTEDKLKEKEEEKK